MWIKGGGGEIPTALKERPLGRDRRRWSNNIKVELHGIGWKGFVLN